MRYCTEYSCRRRRCCRRGCCHCSVNNRIALLSFFSLSLTCVRVKKTISLPEYTGLLSRRHICLSVIFNFFLSLFRQFSFIHSLCQEERIKKETKFKCFVRNTES